MNSPVEELFFPLFAEKKVRVFIKRDDMIHPFISGNKWRKLKYILKRAEAEKKSHLVTFGGAWSNHLLATACAAAKFGYKSTAFVRGERVENPVLTICELFGMSMIYIDRATYRDKKRLFESYFANDKTAFFIDEGGAGLDALAGCSELISELKSDFNHIFCAAGTGTTSAGLIKGIVDGKISSKLHCIPVLKNATFIKTDINQLLGEEFPFDLHLDYHFGGYAKTSVELIKFIKSFASSTGILLDQVYTGKMMFALFDLVEKNTFSPGDKLLAIHTGGLSGLIGLKT